MKEKEYGLFKNRSKYEERDYPVQMEILVFDLTDEQLNDYDAYEAEILKHHTFEMIGQEFLRCFYDIARKKDKPHLLCNDGKHGYHICLDVKVGKEYGKEECPGCIAKFLSHRIREEEK